MFPTPGSIALLIEERIADLPYRPFPMVNILTKVDQFQTAIKWDANVGGGVASGRAATTNPTVQATDQVVGASLPIGDYVIDHTFSILITKLTELGNLPDLLAPRALRSLFTAHIDTAFKVIYPKLNQLIWTGTGAADTTNLNVFGMESVIAAAPYANINPATYPLWASYVNANAGTARPLSKELFAAVEVDMFERGTFYNAIITTGRIAELYKTLYEVSEQHTPMGGDGIADIGYTGLAYKGVPIRKDKDCPEGTLWFVNTGDVELHTFAQGNYGLADPGAYEMSTVTDPTKSEGLNFLVGQLPRTNPQSVSYNISIMPQLKVHDRRAFSVITDIADDLDQIGFSDPDGVLKTTAPA